MGASSYDGAAMGAKATFSTRTWVWILLLLAAAIFARNLTESLWYDEIAAFRDYAVRGPGYLLTNYHDPANHVLQSLLTWASHRALADTLGPEIAIRLPAFLFSLATLPVLFVMGRRLDGPTCGLFAACIGACAPVFALEGTEARGYALMIFFAALATERFDAMYRDGPVRGRVIGYAVAVALGTWAHLMTAWITVGHLIVAMVLRRRSPRSSFSAAAGAVALAAVLSVLAYLPLFGPILEMRETFARADGNEPFPLGQEGLRAVLQMGGSWYAGCAVIGLLLIALGLLALRRAGPGARRIAALSLAGLPLAVVVLTLAGSWMYARFVLFAVPGAALLMAFGLSTTLRRSTIAGMLLIAALATSWLFDYRQRPPRQQIREAVALVKSLREDDDRTLVIGLRARVTDAYTPANWAIEYAPLHGEGLTGFLDDPELRTAIVLYPDHVPEDRWELLRDAGFADVDRLPGWIDDGDIVVLRRD